MTLDSSAFQCLKEFPNRENVSVVLRDSRLTRDGWMALNTTPPRNGGLALHGTPPPDDPEVAAQLTAFSSARIISVKFTDDHLAALVVMPALKSISIERCDFTSADPTILGDLQKIERLSFSNSPIAEDEAAKLRAMLPGCEITIE